MEKGGFEKLFNSLSKEEQELAISIAQGGGLSSEIDYLEYCANELGFNLESTLKGLLEKGLVEIVSYIQELRELSEKELSESDNDRIQGQITDFERNKEPESRYADWEIEDRYRLEPSFQVYIENLELEE